MLIALTFIAVIASIVYLVSRETEQRGTVEFFAVADEATDLHALAAMELESAFAAIGVTPRQDLIGRFARVTELAREADALLDVEVPSAATEPYSLLLTASSAWVSGVTDVEAVMLDLMNAGPADAAVGALSSAIDELRAGDTAYGLFLGSLNDPIEGFDPASFPVITYINPSPRDVLLYDAVGLVLSVSASYELAPHHNVGVTGQLDPSPVGDRGGIPLVPYSETISVTGVVTNSGNESEAVVTVDLEIVNADTNELQTLTQTIADLGGGSSSSVTFDDLAVTPGSLYQVKLTVTIESDNRPEDDIWDIRFIRNEDS